MSSPILTLWTRDNDTAKNARLGLAAERLQAQSASYVIEARSAILTAEATLEAVTMKSADVPRFSDIVDATLAVREAKLTAEVAAEVVSSLFGA